MAEKPGVGDMEKIASALKSAGVVIPLDFGLPGRISTELSKQGIHLGPNIGGFVATHYFIVWRD